MKAGEKVGQERLSIAARHALASPGATRYHRHLAVYLKL